MVLLLQRLGLSLKLSSNLENQHQAEALSASLLSFRSNVSNCLNQLLLNSKPGSEFGSLSWIGRCFEVFRIVNRGFAKLVMDAEHPMSKWGAASVEEYLSYSLKLLELLNCINSSLSHLGLARVSLSHALSLVERSPSQAIERLRPIQLKTCNKGFEEEGKTKGKERVFCGKEWIIHQALMVMKSVGFWTCEIVLFYLCGDFNPLLEMRESANDSLMGLDFGILKEKMDERGVLKEVKELNDAVACLAAAMDTAKCEAAAEDLHRRLEMFEKQLEVLVKEADHLFSEVLAGRNELIDTLGQKQ